MPKDYSNLSDAITPRKSSSLPRCPVLKVLRANKFGLIIESNRSFDVGEEMTIGFHVANPDKTSSFISADSLVVDSQRCSGIRGNLRHRVTLLFSQIGSEDCAKLINLAQSTKMGRRTRGSWGLN